MDYEVADFDEDVLDASREQPVLVDFWAPWCGPCRVLGPTLEKLAGEEPDWKLVKVNTDRHQEISARYGIRGIPAVKLFVDGEVIDEFTGALPEYAVRQWLEKALPSENRQRVERAQAAISAGERDEAEVLLRRVLDEEPQNPEARVLLAQLTVFRDPERAAELVSGAAFAGPGFVQIAEAVETLARLARLDLDALPEGPGRDDYAAAVEALRRDDYEAALEKLIATIQTDRYYDDDGARKACVALFSLLGNDHPATRRYRRRFDMALY